MYHIIPFYENGDEAHDFKISVGTLTALVQAIIDLKTLTFKGKQLITDINIFEEIIVLPEGMLRKEDKLCDNTDIVYYHIKENNAE